MKVGLAKTLPKIVKPRGPCDVLHSKREERGGKDTINIKVTCVFSLTKLAKR